MFVCLFTIFIYSSILSKYFLVRAIVPRMASYNSGGGSSSGGKGRGLGRSGRGRSQFSEQESSDASAKYPLRSTQSRISGFTDCFEDPNPIREIGEYSRKKGRKSTLEPSANIEDPKYSLVRAIVPNTSSYNSGGGSSSGGKEKGLGRSGRGRSQFSEQELSDAPAKYPLRSTQRRISDFTDCFDDPNPIHETGGYSRKKGRKSPKASPRNVNKNTHVVNFWRTESPSTEMNRDIIASEKY